MINLRRLGRMSILRAGFEALSTSGQILISQSTAERVKADFPLKPAGEIEDIKNIAGKFTVFTV